jgi:hypothetical protein
MEENQDDGFPFCQIMEFYKASTYANHKYVKEGKHISLKSELKSKHKIEKALN